MVFKRGSRPLARPFAAGSKLAKMRSRGRALSFALRPPIWRRALGLALALMMLAPKTARAGAWTLPEGNGQIIQSFFGWTGTGAPWGSGAPGQSVSRIEAQTFIEYGLWDRITLFGQIAAER